MMGLEVRKEREIENMVTILKQIELPLYLCERSELWLNRIVSFICGVMTSVLGGYLLGFL